MTRYMQLMQAVDAVRDALAPADAPPEPALMLVQPASFASHEKAEQAADVVRLGAGSTTFEDHAEDTLPTELADRARSAAVRDDLDAERWLDEGGSISSEAMTT
jgi:hypothetical protein